MPNPQSSFLACLVRLSAEPQYFTNLHLRLSERGIVAAVHNRDTAALFAWLVEILSFQGIPASPWLPR